MDQRQLALAACAAVVLLAAAYYLLTGGVGGGDRHAGAEFQVQPGSCRMGSEPLPQNQNGSRVSLYAAFFITNTGQRQTSLPASVYLAVGDEVLDEEILAPYTYPPGAMLFNGSREFSFASHEFRGGQFDPSKVFGGKIDFDFRLIYCEGCSDPLREGIVIYRGNTRDCVRLQCSTCPA